MWNRLKRYQISKIKNQNCRIACGDGILNRILNKIATARKPGLAMTTNPVIQDGGAKPE
jgi:hypothetical protein